MNFTNQIDDELCKNIIENRNLLLSSNPIDQANNNTNNGQIGIDFFSMLDSQSEMSLVDLNQPIFNNDSQPESPDSDAQIFTSEQLGFNDEIIDSDLFEFLRSEDPEVISLLESLDNSDLITKPRYLPQISINTTNQVLDHIQPTNSYSNQTQQQLSIFNLTNDSQFKQEVRSPVSEVNEQVQQEQSNLPASRVSLRLIKRRNNNTNNIIFTDLVKPKKEPKRLKKRNRSIDEEEDESGSLFSSHSNENSSDNTTYNSSKIENSIGYDSDEHIYFDDDDFSPAGGQNLITEEDSNEREFQEFVLNYKQNQKNRNGDDLDHLCEVDGTVKKDANKEAATRYRLKKLSEKDRMFEMRMGLEKENDEIKRRCELVVTEINYLKSLLVQMLLTKGVMSDKLGV
jgi:hypothetical protein